MEGYDVKPEMFTTMGGVGDEGKNVQVFIASTCKLAISCECHGSHIFWYICSLYTYILVYNTINYRSTHLYEDDVKPKEPTDGSEPIKPAYDPAELLLIDRANTLQKKVQTLIDKISGMIKS